MKDQFKLLVSLLFLFSLFLTLGALPASGESAMPENKVPGSVESKARRLMNTLNKQRFQVESSYFKLYPNDDCPTSFAEMKTCWGNNPAAPYVQFAIPPWPEEFIDPATDTAYGLYLDGYHTITPDKFMEETIRQTLGAISVADEDVFTEQIPSNMILGLNEVADDFFTVIRYAMPEDVGGKGAHSTAWREELPLCLNPTAPDCDQLTLSIRNYLPPGSHRGPDGNYILLAWVISL